MPTILRSGFDEGATPRRSNSQRSCPECGHELMPTEDPTFDELRHGVVVDGELRYLTPKRWATLELLRSRAGRNVSRDFINDWVSGNSLDPPDRKIVDIFVFYIRKALEGSPWRIVSVRASGYRLERIPDEPQTVRKRKR